MFKNIKKNTFCDFRKVFLPLIAWSWTRFSGLAGWIGFCRWFGRRLFRNSI
jgi:hypothetical protein